MEKIKKVNVIITIASFVFCVLFLVALPVTYLNLEKKNNEVAVEDHTKTYVTYAEDADQLEEVYVIAINTMDEEYAAMRADAVKASGIELQSKSSNSNFILLILIAGAASLIVISYLGDITSMIRKK